METDVLDTDVGDIEALSEEGDETRSGVYELGYHILPTLSEDEVTAAVSGIMDGLKKEGATFVGDRFPAKIPLAYAIGKRVGDRNMEFDQAYFGWVAFEAPRSVIESLKAHFDAHPSILRYLIVSTSKDAVHAALSGEPVAAVGPTGAIEKPKREAEAGGEVSEVALDEALQTMEKEDAVKE